MGITSEPRLLGGASLGGPATSHWCVVLVIATFVFSGCATTKERGDHAFESADYNQALDHYELVIEKGSRDADLYYRAAEAAVRVGDFSLAERYYSRALRYGGGEKVSRALAEFYVATSNYTKAVRVLQELLETTDNPQSVFNNLGAALMYAGLPLDAESYLLVAQQMRPSDPVPYVNLGVLYDKHMRQPHLALGFYRCFLRLSDAGGQRRKIEARVQALESRVGRDPGKRFGVACNQPYQPPNPPSKDEIRERLRGADASSEDAPKTDEDAAGQGAEAPEEDADTPPPVIYRQVEEIPAEAHQPRADEAPSDDSRPDEPASETSHSRNAEALRLAEQAFATQNHKEVIRHLETLPASALDTHSMALYGRSLAALGEYERAQRWLAGAVTQDASAENVAALIEVYRELGADKKLHQLCERLDDEESLEEVLESCPKKQLIEHLKNKQQ